MKKHINQKEMKKIAKTALAMVLAGTFTLSSTIAFANDTNTENNLETVELQQNATDITTDANVTVPTSNQETVQAKEEVTEPSLIPGDFFYFAKLTIEKIKLILTTDDIKEAKLYAEFATERLAEAEILFAKGEQEKALETIQQALEVMAKADGVITVDAGSNTDTTKTPETPETTDTTKTPETTDTTKTPETTDTTKTPETTDTTKTSETSTTDSTVIVDVPTNDEEVIDEIEKILSQNIIALTAAMEKVQNPVAKAALQKNIEKSYAKLAKKLAKIEARLAKEAEELEKQESIETNEKEVEDSEEVKTETSVNVEKEDATEAQGTTETKDKVESTIVVPTKKEVKAVDKKIRKEIKEQAKKEIKVIKQDAKKSLKELHGKKDNDKREYRKDRNEKHEKNNRHDRHENKKHDRQDKKDRD